ncbi:hypothetical protein ACXFAU_04920 [Paenibacillus glucanolyticus]|uniref:Uncharacterized protein n=1 Tax=Paenibacillus glucanolyticus TaxID=59843 RepID=A0A163KAR3_9BACL|nr:hypothetical protein [Paenibacillus glucanolyticus]KZS47103.1 hypothetical protein AWU65_14795 [Paenibacillus glucanolyticus]
MLNAVILCGTLLIACGNEQPSVSQDTSNPNTQNQGNNNELKSQFPDNGYSIKLDSITENHTVRAQVNTEHGELLVVSRGKEEIGHIEVPSVFGAEGDFTFRGDYDVVLKNDGSEKVIKELNDFIFVQKTDKPLSFEKISFDKVDIYLLTPEYTASRGYNSYAFGIDKENGKVFSLTFKTGNNERETVNYAIDTFPKNEDGMLVVSTRNTEEENAEQAIEKIVYSLDISKKQFVSE